VILFPEGTRSTTGEMAPFREGIGLLATDLGAAVLPVHLAGAYDVLPKGARLPRRRRRVVVRFGPLVTFPAETSITAATAAIEAAVRALARD
jgi:1-acyl-sn-glycerol-3-phosphate acyltransferase